MLSRLRGWLTGAELRRLVRFGAAGVFNTLLTCVSFALMRWADVKIYVDNE